MKKTYIYIALAVAVYWFFIRKPKTTSAPTTYALADSYSLIDTPLVMSDASF